MLALACKQTKSNKKLKKKGSEGLSSKVVQKTTKNAAGDDTYTVYFLWLVPHSSNLNLMQHILCCVLL